MTVDPRGLITHMVVLMLENRSFDHMLGFLGTPNGLTGNESNPVNVAQPEGPRVTVSRDASWTGLAIDPSHSFSSINRQLFGTTTVPPVPPEPSNQGFVDDYARQGNNTATGAAEVMRCFDPARLPVLSTLAREFAVCDRWFSSVPSQTWPNRFFVHCASSGGFLDNKVRIYRMPTIYGNLSRAGASWAIYYHDVPHALALRELRSAPHRNNLVSFSRFERDCLDQTLPSYSFIEPRYFNLPGQPATDQHPPHDVRLGEQLIARVYEAIRRSPSWRSTVLIVTYDEHGGLYDHLLPPACPAPDSTGCEDPPFDFCRLGLRVPCVVVSPYIARGTTDSAHTYDHTSILASAKVLFDLPQFLTERDATAPTIWHLLTGTFRDDTPESLTGVAASYASLSQPQRPSHEPLSEFQESLVALARSFEDGPAGVSMAPAVSLTEHEAALYVQSAVNRFLQQPE